MGPFLLTARLLPRLRGTAGGPPGRVLTMSSGGMYAAPLCVDRLQMSPGDYRGSEQYARAKRAQVTLNEMWAERVDPAEVVFHSMHPGWSDTPGVAASLPTFGKIMGPLLRTPEQAADTLVWLAADTDRGRLERTVLAGPPGPSDPQAAHHPSLGHVRATGPPVGTRAFDLISPNATWASTTADLASRG